MAFVFTPPATSGGGTTGSDRPHARERPIAGLTVLLVEDEALNIIHAEDLFADLGHTVVEVARTMDAGLEAARLLDVDVAALDLNLSGELSLPIAETLRRRGIPFFFLTAYGRWGLEAAFDGVPVVTKPITRAALREALDGLGLLARGKGP